MITKKLNGITFGWNETAFNGKGYWYVMGKNGSFAKAASKLEASELGKPKIEDEAPKSEKVYKEKSIQYAAAQKMKTKGLRDLIADKMLSGESLGKSVKSGISEKFKAKVTRIKQTFDPLNILSAMMGRGKFATTIAARMLGRSASDAKYFMKPSAIKNNSSKILKSNVEKVSKVHKESKIDNKILLKIDHLLETKFQQDKKYRELKKSFDNIEKRKDDDRYNKLLSAVMSLNGHGKESAQTKPKKGSIFGLLASLLAGYEFFRNFLKTKLKSMFKDAFSWLGKKFLKWGKGLWDFLSEKIGWIGSKIKKIATSIWDGVSDVAIKLWKGMKEGLSKVWEIFEKIPGVKKLAEEIIPKGMKAISKFTKPLAEGAEKFGGKAVRVAIKGAESVGKTATKAGSKVLRGAEAMGEFFEKLKPIAKSLPGIDTVFAIGMIADDIYDAIKKYRAGKMNAMGLEKAVIQSITGVLGGTGGAEIGAVLGGIAGSFIPVIGNLIGTIAGGAAGWMGGEWLGKRLGKGMFDFFVNAGDKVSADISKAQKYISELESKFKAKKVLAKTPPKVNKSNWHNTFAAPQTTGSKTNTSQSLTPIKSTTSKSSQIPKLSGASKNIGSKISENNNLKLTNKKTVKPVVINKTVSSNSESHDNKSTLSGPASVRDSSTDAISEKNHSRSFAV